MMNRYKIYFVLKLSALWLNRYTINALGGPSTKNKNETFLREIFEFRLCRVDSQWTILSTRITSWHRATLASRWCRRWAGMRELVWAAPALVSLLRLASKKLLSIIFFRLGNVYCFGMNLISKCQREKLPIFRFFYQCFLRYMFIFLLYFQFRIGDGKSRDGNKMKTKISNFYQMLITRDYNFYIISVLT